MLLLKKLRLSFVILGLLIVSAGALLALNPHWIRIEDIQITLSENSKEDLLFQRIKSSLQPRTKDYEGRYFWQVPLKTVFQAVTQDKRVKSVSIYREFPSILKIEIEPHTPMLGFLSNDGRVYPVATDATLLPPLPIGEVQDLPFLRGEDFKDEPTLREQALELINAIPLDGAFRKSKISEIVHTKKDGFKVFVSGQATEVQMGDSDFGPKISRVNKVMSYLDSRNIKGRVIDARFAKKVVVRVRKAP
jgi:cell division septal protein FtsQ